MQTVYVLTNPAFEHYVKIGFTTNLEQRLKTLDNTSLPLPFRCVYAVAVGDGKHVEALLHEAFADNRVRQSREFFEISPHRVIAALKLTGGEDVTPRSDVFTEDDAEAALERATRRPRKTYKITDAGLSHGDVLYFQNDRDITVEVLDARKVLFEGASTSLSAAALELLKRQGYSWASVNGWQYWMYDGESIAERLERVLSDTVDD